MLYLLVAVDCKARTAEYDLQFERDDETPEPVAHELPPSPAEPPSRQRVNFAKYRERRAEEEMMLRGSVHIGRAGGIPISLHYSWFVIAALITFSLAGHFREVHSEWQPSVLWAVSVLTAILFFATLLAHELSHALVARARGLQVRSITLAALFIGWGLLRFVFGPTVDGLWLAFIGWFLFMAARGTRIEQSIAQSLRDIRVADVMANECAIVAPITTIQVLVDDVLLRTGRRCVIVKSNGHVLGLITPREVRAVDRTRWSDVTVRDIMRPVETLLTVNPATPAAEALTSMLNRDLDQLPVVADSRLQGMISRGQILQLLQSRAELLKRPGHPLVTR